ncbi:TRAP transporter small permease subunit [Agrobacterium sp. CNPSo 2736]|uniref:TRAP transporter small permease n=1 Tax=Agrobacterium sp. CNPSo 2736 TaxID=2499627 RepID=UPI000FD97EFE|nr:TRAP transporter small permease subunit [Agrobacterium sp. CNPSo 2736]RVT73032.1 TRAP transporter small permease subunit [Agrobacterium sp. CNPSo 2736]
MLTLLDKITKVVAVLLLLGLLSCVLLGVLSRLFRFPLSWTDELSQYLLVWCAFLGWTIATNTDSHIRIIFFQNIVYKRIAKLIEILIRISLFLIGGFLSYQSISLIKRTVDIQWVSLPISSSLLYIPIIFVGIIVMLRAALDVVVLTRGPKATSRRALWFKQ